MPITLTSDGSTFPEQRCPQNGEPRDQLSLEQPFQDSTNRTEFVHDRIVYLDPDKTGARRFRHVPDVAALAGLTDIPEGSFVWVDALGPFQYSQNSTLAEVSPVIVRPNSVAPGSTGRWIFAVLLACGSPNGLASLDQNGDVPAEQMRDGFVDGARFVEGGAVTVPQNNTIQTHATVVVTLDLKAGDTIEFTAAADVYGTSGDKVAITTQFSAPGTPTLTSGLKWGSLLPSSDASQLHDVGYYTVGTDNTYTIRLQYSGKSTNAAVASLSNAYLITKAYR